jgi:serine/threonine protein kinase
MELENTILGKMIEGYEVISQLGEGAMGRVYLAKHPMIGKRIAIKSLRPELVRTHGQMTRFLREAQTVNEIGHQNVVDIFNFVYRQETKEAYILMEFLEGQTLAEVIERESPLPVKRVAYIGQQVCSALFAAHECGIIHRDLKPENIFLTNRVDQKDFVKLIDFGLAKLLESGEERPITFHGTLLGTPAYMSPEQALGEPIDLRADLYALGLVLYEAATGVLPFASNTLQETLAGRLLFQAPTLRTYRADIPLDFEAVILRCLSKSREARFSSAKELGEQLALTSKSRLSGFSLRNSSNDHLNATLPSSPNNPWNEPELTVQQESSKEGPTKVRLTIPKHSIEGEPLLSASTLSLDDPWHEVTQLNPSHQSLVLQEVASEEIMTLSERNQPPPVAELTQRINSQEGHELQSHEFIEDIDNDLDVPTEDSWEKPKLKP